MIGGSLRRRAVVETYPPVAVGYSYAPAPYSPAVVVQPMGFFSGWFGFHDRWAAHMGWLEYEDYSIWHGWQQNLATMRIGATEQRKLLYGMLEQAHGDMSRRELKALTDRMINMNQQLGADEGGHVEEVKESTTTTTTTTTTKNDVTVEQRYQTANDFLQLLTSNNMGYTLQEAQARAEEIRQGKKDDYVKAHIASQAARANAPQPAQFQIEAPPQQMQQAPAPTPVRQPQPAPLQTPQVQQGFQMHSTASSAIDNAPQQQTPRTVAQTISSPKPPPQPQIQVPPQATQAVNTPQPMQQPMLLPARPQTQQSQLPPTIPQNQLQSWPRSGQQPTVSTQMQTQSQQQPQTLSATGASPYRQNFATTPMLGSSTTTTSTTTTTTSTNNLTSAMQRMSLGMPHPVQQQAFTQAPNQQQQLQSPQPQQQQQHLPAPQQQPQLTYPGHGGQQPQQMANFN